MSLAGTVRHPQVYRQTGVIYTFYGIIGLILSNLVSAEDWSAVSLFCIPAIGYSVLQIYRGFVDGPSRILTDPFLVLITSFTMYYLYGPLLLVYGSEVEIMMVQRWYFTTAQETLYITGMNFVCMGTLLFSAGLINNSFSKTNISALCQICANFPSHRIFFLFFSIGLIAKTYVFLIDVYDETAVVVGIIRTMTLMAEVAILIGAMHKGPFEKQIRLLTILLTIWLSWTGMVLFSKTDALRPWIALLIGVYLRKPNWPILIAGIVLVPVGLATLANPTIYARGLLSINSDHSIAARMDILRQLFNDWESFQSQTKQSSGWARLCYVSVQNSAIALYDNDDPGDDLELIPWLIVPRVLVPEKPIMTRSGTDFNLKLSGSDTSSAVPGLFVSGYYNLGWLGAIIVSIAAGWIMAQFAELSRTVIAHGAVGLLPLVFIGHLVAFRIDGHFLADYLSPFAMILLPLYIGTYGLKSVVNMYQGSRPV